MSRNCYLQKSYIRHDVISTARNCILKYQIRMSKNLTIGHYVQCCTIGCGICHKSTKHICTMQLNLFWIPHKNTQRVHIRYSHVVDGSMEVHQYCSLALFMKRTKIMSHLYTVGIHHQNGKRRYLFIVLVLL